MISVSLLILTIVTIWAFKKFRVRFIHETGMSVLYGMAHTVNDLRLSLWDFQRRLGCLYSLLNTLFCARVQTGHWNS